MLFLAVTQAPFKFELFILAFVVFNGLHVWLQLVRRCLCQGRIGAPVVKVGLLKILQLTVPCMRSRVSYSPDGLSDKSIVLERSRIIGFALMGVLTADKSQPLGMSGSLLLCSCRCHPAVISLCDVVAAQGFSFSAGRIVPVFDTS